MRVLTVCQYGYCRSVALARVICKASKGEAVKPEVVAVGWETCGLAAMKLLCGWADTIIVLQAGYEKYVVKYLWSDQQDKVFVFDVGPDVWSDPYHPDLYARLLGMWAKWLQERKQIEEGW